MSATGASTPSDPELLNELRELAIAIQKDPTRKRLIINEWYERTLHEKGPQRAEMGMLLLNILNARRESPGLDLQGVAEKTLVLSLHGIRTRGEWQKQLSASLTRAGFVYVPLDYGFFRAIQLVAPWAREAKMKWFLDQYTEATKGNEGPPSVIAHSMGTYLVARALEKYQEVKFDRIIFCGSIVNIDYPWSSIVQAGRTVRVLNDYGGQDFWAKAAEWFVNDAGPSGAKGFDDNAGGRVLKRYRPKFRHSDFFYEANYEKTWIPFLQGTDPDEAPLVEGRPANWKFRCFLWAVIVIGLVLFGLGLRYFRTARPHGDVRTPHGINSMP